MGLKELTQFQIEEIDPIWKSVVRAIENNEELPFYAAMSDEETKLNAKWAFEKEDNSRAGFLSPDELASFIHEIGKDLTDDDEDAFSDAICSFCEVKVVDGVENFYAEPTYSWKEIERVFDTLNCWVKKGKAQFEMSSSLGTPQKQASKQQS